MIRTWSQNKTNEEARPLRKREPPKEADTVPSPKRLVVEKGDHTSSKELKQEATEAKLEQEKSHKLRDIKEEQLKRADIKKEQKTVEKPKPNFQLKIVNATREETQLGAVNDVKVRQRAASLLKELPSVGKATPEPDSEKLLVPEQKLEERPLTPKDSEAKIVAEDSEVPREIFPPVKPSCVVESLVNLAEKVVGEQLSSSARIGGKHSETAPEPQRESYTPDKSDAQLFQGCELKLARESVVLSDANEKSALPENSVVDEPEPTVSLSEETNVRTDDSAVKTRLREKLASKTSEVLSQNCRVESPVDSIPPKASGLGTTPASFPIKDEPLAHVVTVGSIDTFAEKPATPPARLEDEMPTVEKSEKMFVHDGNPAVQTRHIKEVAFKTSQALSENCSERPSVIVDSQVTSLGAHPAATVNTTNLAPHIEITNSDSTKLVNASESREDEPTMAINELSVPQAIRGDEVSAEKIPATLFQEKPWLVSPDNLKTISFESPPALKQSCGSVEKAKKNQFEAVKRSSSPTTKDDGMLAKKLRASDSGMEEDESSPFSLAMQLAPAQIMVSFTLNAESLKLFQVSSG